MSRRLPLVLSTLALVIALLGSTPLGSAAGDAVGAVPPFAKRAGFARFAGTADNAKRLSGHRARVNPGPGDLPVVGPNGKLPASIGTVGPEGPKGDKGEKGERGASAAVIFAAVNPDATIISSKGVASVVRQYTGQYSLTVDRNVSECAAVASASQAGWIATSHGSSGNQVVVLIRTAAGAEANAAFRVAVLC